MINSDNYNIYAPYYDNYFKDNLKFPSYHPFRHYRGKTISGIWKKIPFRINNKEDLKRWVLKLGIVDLYYSTSGWLNPHKVASKGRGGSYKVADNCLLFNDLTFDIDAPEPITMRGLEEARRLALKIHGLLSNDNTKNFLHATFTGNKGFRLVYQDLSDKTPHKAANRVSYIEEKRKIFIHAFKHNLTKKEISMLDEQITTNPLCVVRVIGSVNSKTGFLSVELSIKNLKKPIKTILKNYVPVIQHGKGRPGKNTDGVLMTTEDDSKKRGLPCPRPEVRGKDASGLASPSNHYFFTNKVIGTKCYIPVFKYPKICPLSDKLLRRMQEKEKLGTLYLFTGNDDRYVFSLKVMQRRAIAKLLAKYYSNNAPQFIRRHKVLIPVHLIFEKKITGGPIKGISRGHAMTLAKTKGDSGVELLEIIQATEA